MDDETVKRLNATDWGLVGNQLLAHAISRARNYDWQSGNSWELAMGRTPLDVAQEVIDKTLRGERKWDYRKRELLPWLKDQVNSVMDALARSASHRHEYYMPGNDDDPAASTRFRSSALKPSDLAAADMSLSPEESAMREEEIRYAATVTDALFKAVAGDAELERVLDVLRGGANPSHVSLPKNWVFQWNR